jgi:hypothetical protein
MRTAASTIGLLCGAIGLITLAATPAPAQLDRGLTPPPCSVLSGHPCHPSFCGVFRHGPCFPQHLPPIGQDLRLTIAAAEEKPKDKPVTDRSESEFVDNIQEMFRALRACWIPPPPGKSQPGMEYTVRFAFKSNGEPMGPPRVTYATRGVPRKCAMFISKPWKRRSSAARRCISRGAWPAPLPGGRSSFTFSTIASCPGISARPAIQAKSGDFRSLPSESGKSKQRRIRARFQIML